MKPISAVFIPEHDDIDGEILMISAYMDQGKSGSSTHVPKMSNFAILALISCLFTTSRGMYNTCLSYRFIRCSFWLNYLFVFMQSDVFKAVVRSSICLVFSPHSFSSSGKSQISSKL